MNFGTDENKHMVLELEYLVVLNHSVLLPRSMTLGKIL